MKPLPILALSLAVLLSASAERIAPMKGLKIHEWGVFVVGENETLAAVGGAPLDFMRRIEMPEQGLGKGGGGAAGPGLPVLHIYADSPLHLQVEVAFSQGRPTLAWPEPSLSWLQKEGSKGNRWPALTWEVQTGVKEGPRKRRPVLPP